MRRVVRPLLPALGVWIMANGSIVPRGRKTLGTLSLKDNSHSFQSISNKDNSIQ